MCRFYRRSKEISLMLLFAVSSFPFHFFLWFLPLLTLSEVQFEDFRNFLKEGCWAVG